MTRLANPRQAWRHPLGDRPPQTARTGFRFRLFHLPINPKYNSTQCTTPKYIQENRTTHKNKSELKITKKKLYMIVFKID